MPQCKRASRLACLLLALTGPGASAPAAFAQGNDIAARLVAAAHERLAHRVVYDGSYRRIDYPNGDVPGNVGVCTDLVIRAYRGIGVDLQRAVHEDMQAHFSDYPALWGLTRPDPNIDHRRVPNLRTFFARHGESFDISTDARRYRPGDLVTWRLPGNLPHIGIVSDRRSVDRQRPLIVHNIGAGPKLEDVLFEFEMTGHYRYTPTPQP